MVYSIKHRFFGGQEKFEILKENDRIKDIYCIQNNIQLLRIKYDENIEQILKQKINNNYELD